VVQKGVTILARTIDSKFRKTLPNPQKEPVPYRDSPSRLFVSDLDQIKKISAPFQPGDVVWLRSKRGTAPTKAVIVGVSFDVNWRPATTRGGIYLFPRYQALRLTKNGLWSSQWENADPTDIQCGYEGIRMPFCVGDNVRALHSEFDPKKWLSRRDRQGAFSPSRWRKAKIVAVNKNKALYKVEYQDGSVENVAAKHVQSRLSLSPSRKPTSGRSRI
jgi:hypothetical protein